MRSQDIRKFQATRKLDPPLELPFPRRHRVDHALRRSPVFLPVAPSLWLLLPTAFPRYSRSEQALGVGPMLIRTLSEYRRTSIVEKCRRPRNGKLANNRHRAEAPLG